MVVADPTVILFATALTTALVGLAVAGIAYRGYRRNASEPMRFLAIGIFFITVVPFLMSYGIGFLANLPEAVLLLGVLGANILGLLSILYSLEGA